MTAHDATVTEATLKRAKERLEAMGMRNAVHAFLSREPFLGDFVLGKLFEVLDSDDKDERPGKDFRRRQKVAMVALIACEAVRIAQSELWNTQDGEPV